VVRDTTIKKKNHKAEVIYTLHCNEPYTLHNIQYSSGDSIINTIINNDKVNSLFHSGNHYDEDIIEKERERIARGLRNRGYYFFTKNYITIEPDSALGSHQVDIYLYVNRLNENIEHAANVDLLPEDHHTYHLNNFFVRTDFNPKEPNEAARDYCSL